MWLTTIQLNRVVSTIVEICQNTFHIHDKYLKLFWRENTSILNFIYTLYKAGSNLHKCRLPRAYSTCMHVIYRYRGGTSYVCKLSLFEPSGRVLRVFDVQICDQTVENCTICSFGVVELGVASMFPSGQSPSRVIEFQPRLNLSGRKAHKSFESPKAS